MRQRAGLVRDTALRVALVIPDARCLFLPHSDTTALAQKDIGLVNRFVTG